MGYIYKITNIINNKIYIGQTSNSIEQRFKSHIREAKQGEEGCRYLNNAIRKYGADNFIVEELEECIDALLSEKEKHWIEKLSSHYSTGKGYNISYGGEGTLKITDKQILDLWDEGFSAHEIAKRLKVKDNTICDRLKVLKPGESQQRRAQLRKIKIKQYDLNGDFIKEWDSAIEAARFYGSDDSSSIVRCCKKERNFAFNSFWLYSNDDTNIEELKIKYALSTQCREVLQINPDTNEVINYFESGAAAEKALNLPRGKVSEVCNHKRKTTGGYKWEWKYKTKREIVNGTYRNAKEDN